MPYSIKICQRVTLKKLIKRRDLILFLGILTVFTFLYPSISNKRKAGKPIITLKLKGGIASIAILNKDQTELQTKTKIIKSNTVTNCFEKISPIKNPMKSKQDEIN